MKHVEKLTHIVLVLLTILALVAVALQIANEKTSPIETVYEIITFSVALVAVMLAVMQGLANARTTRELTKITHEIRELMNDIKQDEQSDNVLKMEIKHDLELDRQAIEMIKEQ